MMGVGGGTVFFLSADFVCMLKLSRNSRHSIIQLNFFFSRNYLVPLRMKTQT